MNTNGLSFDKMKELGKLLELEETADIIATVVEMSDDDVRLALVFSLLVNQRNRKMSGMQQQQIEDTERKLAEANSMMDVLQKQTNAPTVQTEPSPDDYELTISEYNMALMILFMFDLLTPFFAEQAINRAIKKYESPTLIQDEAAKLFTDSRRHFARCFQREREKYGYIGVNINLETCERIYVTNPDTPAINFLYKFRVKDPCELILGGKPNLGNIRAVKPAELAANPSDGFVKFMVDLADYYAGQPSSNAYTIGRILK